MALRQLQNGVANHAVSKCGKPVPNDYEQPHTIGPASPRNTICRAEVDTPHTAPEVIRMGALYEPSRTGS